MCPIKLSTKPVFRIFLTLKINTIIMPFCYLFMERPLTCTWYFDASMSTKQAKRADKYLANVATGVWLKLFEIDNCLVY